MKAFDDTAIQTKAKEAVLNILTDKEVVSKLNEMIDARIDIHQPNPNPQPQPSPPPSPITGLDNCC